MVPLSPAHPVAPPNPFTIGGPHNASTVCNAVRCIEQNVEWVADCLRFMRDAGYTALAPSVDAENAWTAHVRAAAEETLLVRDPSSSFFGANTPGKARSIAIYAPGAAAYRERCDEVARRGYEGFEFR